MVSTRKCRGCGNEYEVIESGTRCPYCDTVLESNLINSTLDERLFNARNLRRVGRFKEARSEYQGVIDINENIKEAHFGLFLCDYGVREYRLSGREVELCRCTSCSRISAKENEHFLTALDNSLNREIWEKVMLSIESRREFNVKVQKQMPDFSLLLLCNLDDPADRGFADEMYDILKDKIDVLYPPKTFADIDSALWSNCIQIAMKRITVAAIISSSSASALSKSPVSDLYKDFRDTHKDYQLIPIVTDLYNIPTDMFEDPEDANYIEYDAEETDFDDILRRLFRKMRACGAWSFQEMSVLEETGRIFLNENTESPVLPSIK